MFLYININTELIKEQTIWKCIILNYPKNNSDVALPVYQWRQKSHSVYHKLNLTLFFFSFFIFPSLVFFRFYLPLFLFFLPSFSLIIIILSSSIFWCPLLFLLLLFLLGIPNADIVLHQATICKWLYSIFLSLYYFSFYFFMSLPLFFVFPFRISMFSVAPQSFSISFSFSLSF